MKKKQIVSIIASLFVGLVFAIGLSYVSAAWTDPLVTPTGNNMPIPVNMSSNDQVKVGSLSVNTFLANLDASFDQDVYFKGTLFGGTNAASAPLRIGGLSGGNNYTVVANVDGYAQASQQLGSQQLINGNNATLCADDQGHIVLCSPTSGGSTTQQYYSNCFIADTQVTLANGTKENIQDVKIGDVLKGDTTNNTVIGYHRPPLADGRLYSFNGGRYFVTAEHPFMTTKGWKSIDPSKTAKENIGITVTPLHVGDVLITDHGLEKIATIDSKAAAPTTPLYNFLLNGDHTYFADGYLVHNKAQCLPSLSCSSNIPCIDSTGYPSSTGGGTCAIGCVVNGTQYPFCTQSNGSVYCPNSAGQC